jgi:Tfp pilus assembly protein PilX
MTTSRDSRDDAGAVLILALVFIIVIAVVLLALVTLSGNDLLNTSNLKAQRSLEYAADGATTAAVQAVRNSYLAYNGTVGTSGALCTPQGVVITQLNGDSMIVDCTNQAYNPPTGPNPSAQTRVVNFYTCHGTSVTAGACSASNALVQAQVTFDDYAPSGGYSCSPGNTTTCGTAETIDTWVVESANN